ARSLVIAALDNRGDIIVDRLLGTPRVSEIGFAMSGWLAIEGGPPRIDPQMRAIWNGTAELLAGEPAVVEGSLPVIRAAVLDTAIDQATRAKLLNLVGAMTGRPSIDVAAKLFAQVNPTPAQAANADATGPV